MTPEERSAAAMTECRSGPIVDVSPTRTIAIYADAIREAVKAEREACAVLAEDFRRHRFDEAGTEPESIARLIRARGEK